MLENFNWGAEHQCQPPWGTGNQHQKNVVLKINVMGMTLKRSVHKISASGTDSGDISVTGTDFQRVYFPQ